MITTTLQPVRPLNCNPPRDYDAWVLSRRLTDSPEEPLAANAGPPESFLFQNPAREFLRTLCMAIRPELRRG